MATVCKLTVIKRFTYRGNPEEWSNSYYLSGVIPADATAWRALFDAMVTQEKTIYTSATTVVRGYGHDSDDPHAVAVWTVDLTVSPDTPVPGTMVPSGAHPAPGDCAVWVRWKTSRVTSPGGKAIYLRKYFHDAHESDTVRDVITTPQTTALNALGAKLRDGSFISGRTLRSGAVSETLLSHGASPYITTRTLKRRGKRP